MRSLSKIAHADRFAESLLRVRWYEALQFGLGSLMFHGLLFAAATLYYTAAGYYGWNQPLPSKPPGTSMNAPWWLYVFVAIGIALLITAWVMIFIRRRKKTEIVSSIPDYDYSDDPEAEATDKQAYKKILAFALDRVIPACETQADLQDELISRVCDNAVIAHLANVGVRQSDKTSEFWRHYTELTAGLLAKSRPNYKV